jgi:transglutaminase-like putative cysteine protease
VSAVAPPRPPRQPVTPPGRGDAARGAAAAPRAPLARVVRRQLVGDDLLTLALALLALAAVVPLRSVFIGTDWVRPVAGGVLLAVGIGWCARRLRVGPITHLLMTAAGLLVFATIAFVPSTALAGVLPTATTLEALRDVFVRGLELVEQRAAPTFAEAGLLLLAVAGTWVMTYLADGVLFVLRSGTKAVACALVTWSVPLAVAPGSAAMGAPVLALLAAAALLLLLAGARQRAGQGLVVTAPGRDGAPRAPRAVPPAGWVVAGAAIAVGALLAPLLPGFGADPLVAPRRGAGTTITTNPLVDTRPRLVAGDTGPVLVVRSPRPVYLRTTALDRYDADEQWTAGTISGDRVQGAVDTPPDIPREPVEVGITVAVGIEQGAVLAPAPFQPVAVTGEKAADMRYDRRTATLTTTGDAPLQPGDAYTVTAALPAPEAEALRAIPVPATGSALTELPPNVPPEVTALARQVVADAGAVTMFDMALAVQDHLRAWTYSTDPPQGIGATAMLRFLNTRTGYCEQFAGTMAVMLRSLGIPARLAVGYTPGTLQEDGTWRVSNANAHAWVEVDFGTAGFVAFEPTPRTDGNVLVTGPDAVVPTQTVGQREGREPSVGDPVGPGELADLQPTTPPSLDPASAAGATAAPAVPGAGADAGGRRVAPALLLAGLVGIGALVAVRRRRVAEVPPPAVRIAAARARAEQVGRAVGSPRVPSETDAEYFGRLSGGARAGLALADPATRSVFAPAVTPADAARAEDAAASLVGQLVDDLPGWRRGLVAARARAGALASRGPAGRADGPRRSG